MESDWKKFRAIVPMLRERYLTATNARIVNLFRDPKKTETEHFWDAMEEMEKQAKVLQRCLDGHSRSKMVFFMLTMIRAGMLRKEDLAGFSVELLAQVDYAFEERPADRSSD